MKRHLFFITSTLPTLMVLMMVLILSLTGCGDEPPPHWVNVCVRQQFTHFMMLPVPAGKSITLIPVAQYKCVQYTQECRVGRNYPGPHTCN